MLALAPGDAGVGVGVGAGVESERLAVAIATYRAGYFLLDVIEIPTAPEDDGHSPGVDAGTADPGDDRPDGTDGIVEARARGHVAAVAAAWARVWAVASVTDAQAFVVRGPVDAARVEALAGDLRMVVRYADARDPAAQARNLGDAPDLSDPGSVGSRSASWPAADPG